MDARDIKHSHFAQLPDSHKEKHLKALADQPDMVTGYHVMSDGTYGGEYTFHNNKDKFEIHWPPNVVPVAPPEIPEGKIARWNGNAWVIEDDTRWKGDNTDIPNPLYEKKSKSLSEEERLRFLPMPTGVPVRDANGNFPMTVLNEDKSAWVWKYPDTPPDQADAPVVITP